MSAVGVPAEAVVVLVGAAASGKTTVRKQLLAAGAASCDVLSLDEERAALRDRDLAAGREPRELQDYSLPAVRRWEAAAQDLSASGRGYVADATHLRRRERVTHVRSAHAVGLPAVAILLPALPADVLSDRNALRPVHRRVPENVLARHVHRRSLLSAELLRAEGFDQVVEVAPQETPGGCDALLLGGVSHPAR